MTIKQTLHPIGPDVVAVLSLLLCGVIYTNGLYEHFDVWFYDESAYLHNGINLINVVPSGENAPLYAIWYYLLSIVQPDLLSLYYLNLRVLSVTLPMFAYVALRVVGSRAVVSFIASLYILACWGNYLVWPKVSHFLLLVVLAGVICSVQVKSLTFKVAIFASAALLAAYVRPEFFVSFGIFVIGLVALIFRQAHKLLARKYFIGVGSFILAWTSLLAWLSLPVGGGNRSLIAFGQHFASNYVDWSGDKRNPITMWGEILADNFGQISNAGQSIFINPAAVLHHIGFNLFKFPHAFFNVFGGTNSTSHILMLSISIFFLALGFATGLLNVKKIAQFFAQILRTKFNKFPREILFLLPFFIPTIIAIFAIYPRIHYIIILGVLSLVGVCGFTSYVFNMQSAIPSKTSEKTELVSVFLVCCLSIFLIRPLHSSLEIVNLPNLKTIEFVKTLKLTDQVKMLEAEGGYSIYLGSNFQRIAEYDKNSSFDDFMAHNNVNMIVLSPGLQSDQRFLLDPKWLEFIAQPEIFDFVEKNVPGTDERKILIHRKLLGSSS